MIIETFLTVIFEVMNALMIFRIPNFPEEAMSYINIAFDYLATGAGLVANYTPFSYLVILFGVILAIDAGIAIYHFVMWILRKIPLAGIS